MAPISILVLQTTTNGAFLLESRLFLLGYWLSLSYSSQNLLDGSSITASRIKAWKHLLDYMPVVTNRTSGCDPNTSRSKLLSLMSMKILLKRIMSCLQTGRASDASFL